MKSQIETQTETYMTTKDWVAVFAAALGAFMAILDIQITNASMREIQGALGLDFSESGWVSTSYLIAEIIVIPLTAYLSKVFGMRLYMLINCALFIMASMLCGATWNLNSLIFFRILQGIAGGSLIPMAFQIMILYMPPEKKNVGLALFGLVATLAPTLGPSLGGWLTFNYGWRTIFFINLFPGLIMFVLLRFSLPRSPVNFERLKKLDYFGAVTLSLALGMFTYFLEEGAKVDWFEENKIRISFLVVVAVFPIFILAQTIKKDPLLNLNLFKEINFTLTSIITMMSAVALYGGMYGLSLFLGQVQNYSSLNIGSVMMWVGIPQLFVMPLVPTLMKKVDLRLLAAVGIALFAFSNYLNVNLNGDYGGDQFKLSLIIRALGQPLFMIPLSALGMAMISPAQVGNASAILNSMRNLGGSIGIALVGTIITTRQASHFSRLVDHLSLFETSTNERITALQNGLMLQGMDATSGKTLAMQVMAGQAQKEGVIMAFSDVFLLMAFGLALCLPLILFLKKSKNAGALGEMH